jgi:hypothetical protein
MRQVRQRIIVAAASVALVFSLLPAFATPPYETNCDPGDNCECGSYYTAIVRPNHPDGPVVLVEHERCFGVPFR